MSEKFVNIDRDTPVLLPVDMREWLPEGHLAHFVIEVVGSMDVSAFKVNFRGSGSAQYPPSMLLALLVYCYATGRFSSGVRATDIHWKSFLEKCLLLKALPCHSARDPLDSLKARQSIYGLLHRTSRCPMTDGETC